MSRRYPVILGFDTARAAHWARRTRDYLISATTFVRLVADLALGRVREVWVGDSHTVHINREFVTANLLRGTRPGVYVVHLGSRLMFSIATNGYPTWSLRVLRLIATGSRRPIPMYVCLGEIDVRCHLAKHGSPGAWPLTFVDGFVARTADLAHELGFQTVVFVAPPPPCLDHLNVGSLPVIGDFPTRVSAFDALRGELATACARRSDDVRLVDATPLLFDPVLGIRDGLTDDQCHVNPTGARLVRGEVDALWTVGDGAADRGH